MKLRLLMALVLVGRLWAGEEGFEKGLGDSAVGTWGGDGITVYGEKGKSGERSLRIAGGEGRVGALDFGGGLKVDSELSFWCERWTRRGPFEFKMEVKRGGKWVLLEDFSKVVKVGGFDVRCEVGLKVGDAGVRWVVSSPEGSGLLVDDVLLVAVKPMMVKGLKTVQPVVPVLVGKKVNPVVGFVVEVDGVLAPKRVVGVEVNLKGTSRVADVKAVRLISGGHDEAPGVGEDVGEVGAGGVFKGDIGLVKGANYFWVSVELKDGVDIDGRVDAGVVRVKFSDGSVMEPAVVSPEGAQRIGVAVRQRGDDGAKSYRIPGLVTTGKGTLIGVYDARWQNGGDLPGDIDVGMSRSVDGGRTWEKMKVVMDMGDDVKWRYDGVGDPAILVDPSNDRIWIAGLWSHGNMAWHGSGQGLEPEETGQVVLVYSDDDGVTWSKPVNITKQVKRAEWHLFLQGPGAGIAMKDGTLVFAAQYQDGSKKADGGKTGLPFSTIMYSKDHGETWASGTGVKSNTTEAQVVELADGSLMLNCRDNRGGSRTVGVTKDLGQSWELHPTDRKGLNEPVCMASLLRFEGKRELLIFSNPNTRSGRDHMTLKVSDDDGMTWPEKWWTLYDVRGGAGYSCLTQVDAERVGVLYEGSHELYYLRFKVGELMGE